MKRILHAYIRLDIYVQGLFIIWIIEGILLAILLLYNL